LRSQFRKQLVYLVKSKTHNWEEYKKKNSNLASTVNPGWSAWLPADMWAEVFQYLDAYEVCQCSSVCKDMNAAANRDEIWRLLCEKQGFTSNITTTKTKVTETDIRTRPN
jgi:hypothetical protein